MHFPLKAAALILLLVCVSAPAGRAQVPDTLGKAPDTLRSVPDTLKTAPGPLTTARDTGRAADSTALADTSSYLPLKGIGGMGGEGLLSAVLHDTAAEFIPFRTTGDILRQFRGIFVSETGLGGFRRKFSVNGMRDGALAFLADGLLLNDPSTGLFLATDYPAGNAGTIVFAPPPSGFASSPGGAGGTVDLMSRTLRARRAVSRIRYTQSVDGFSILDGSLSRDVTKGFNVGLGLQRHVSDGRFLNSATDAWGGRVKLRYDMDGAAVYASDIFTRRETGLFDGVSPATPESLRFEPIRALVVNPSAAERIARHDIAAGAAVGRDSSGLTTFDLEFTTARREYRDEAGDTGSTGTPFRGIRDEQSSGFRIGRSQEIAGSTLFVGIEMRSRRLLADPDIGAHRSTQTGISGSLTLYAGPFLSVSPSARFDRYLDRKRLSAGASVRLRFAEWLALTGAASRSHRFPSFAEAYGIEGLASPLESPDPERHDMVSGGIFAGDSAGTFASVSVFHRRISGVITLDSAAGVPTGGAPLAWRRTGDESRSGVSGAAALRIGSFLAELDADYLSYGKRTARRYAPAWDLTAGIYIRDRMVGGHLNLKSGFRGRYFSRYDGEGYSQRYGLFVPSGDAIPPAGTLDFVLFAGIGDAVIHFIWENLLDREYVMTVFYPMDGRAIRFGLTWNFLD